MHYLPPNSIFTALRGSVCRTVQGANSICKIHNEFEDFMKLHTQGPLFFFFWVQGDKDEANHTNGCLLVG